MISACAYINQILQYYTLTTVYYFLGLPALSIALNEQRLYWVGDSSSCTFAIEFNDPTNPFVVSNYSATDILTLSPGQQPLPSRCGVHFIEKLYKYNISLMHSSRLSVSICIGHPRTTTPKFSYNNKHHSYYGICVSSPRRGLQGCNHQLSSCDLWDRRGEC